MSADRAGNPRRPGDEGPEDSELLRRYAETRSERAFAELVRRRVDLVYSVALRQSGGDRHRAEDATQAVFTDLARKAAVLARRPVLVGWLYRSARYAAAGLVRREQRRQTREKEAHTMETLLTDHARDAEWQQLRPVLDEVLAEIDEADRDAVLLRFFDGRPFAEIGARLRLPENTARMRVDRALDKLNAALARRGITSTTAALSAVLAQPITSATPAGFASAVTGVALAQTSVSATGWFAAAAGLSKVQIGLAAAMLAAGAGAFVWQHQTNASLRGELLAVSQQQQLAAALRTENQRLAATAAEVELLRQDDAEFRRLTQQVAEAQQALAEKARVARGREALRATEQNVQGEIDRLNREGNVLVGEFKQLTARSKDQSLPAAERTNASAAAKLKLTEIQAKQREIQAFIAAARAAHPELAQTNVGTQFRRSDAIAADAAARQSRRAAADAASPGTTREAERVSVQLPNADWHTGVSALEKISGTRIIRDPSLAHVTGTFTLQADRSTKEEAIAMLRSALRDRFNIVLEPTPDGALVARVVAGR